VAGFHSVNSAVTVAPVRPGQHADLIGDLPHRVHDDRKALVILPGRGKLAADEAGQLAGEELGDIGYVVGRSHAPHQDEACWWDWMPAVTDKTHGKTSCYCQEPVDSSSWLLTIKCQHW